MPTRNSRKEYSPDAYYHVYSRGVNRRIIFKDEQDYSVFLGYLKRYLSPDQSTKANRQKVRKFDSELDLLCYCLMPNHVHLLFYQHDNERAIAELMQRIFTTYSMYFNKKYKRCGPLFQGRYLASRIDSDSYLLHISRYIHLNPRMWRTWEYSSLQYFINKKRSNWVHSGKILALFNDYHTSYLDFVVEYEQRKDELEHLKHQLTNS